MALDFFHAPTFSHELVSALNFCFFRPSFFPVCHSAFSLYFLLSLFFVFFTTPAGMDIVFSFDFLSNIITQYQSRYPSVPPVFGGVVGAHGFCINMRITTSSCAMI